MMLNKGIIFCYDGILKLINFVFDLFVGINIVF